jgi:hypothetical protein
MKTHLSADEQRIVLDHLLSQTLGCLHGAIDFWTTVCIAQIPPDPRAFVLRHAEVLRSHVVVARTLLETNQLATPERSQRMTSMYAACQKPQDAFLTLVDNRKRSLEEVRSATERVAKVYSELREEIRQLAHSLNVSLSFWERMTPAFEEYFQKILHGLFDQFRREGGGPQPAVPVTTGAPPAP